MGNTGKSVAARRDWMFGSARTQQLAARIVEELDRAEEELNAVEAALQARHPAPAQLCSFVRGELSREENRALVRHLLTGCPQCRQVTARFWTLVKRSRRQQARPPLDWD